MIPEHIMVLTSSGKSERLECQETTGTRQEAAMTVCAFLDRGGGQVLVGTAPNNGAREGLTMNAQAKVS